MTINQPVNPSGETTSLAHFVAKDRIDDSHGVVLYIDDLTVKFDTFTAIDKLSLHIKKGELRCIIGPNGAGKTTLMDVITGKTSHRNATITGEVFLGQSIDLLKQDEPEIAQLGIGRKFQKPSVFEELQVWENLLLACKGNKHWSYALTARITPHNLTIMNRTISTMQLEREAYRKAGELSHGQKQRLEIGMLLMQQPQILLLDEPVAGMTDQETAQLANILEAIRGTYSILVIEHDMGFVASLAKDTGIVTVLAAGRVLAEGTMQKVQSNENVIESYLGR